MRFEQTISKLSKKDKAKILDAYFKKREEYSKLTLDELKAIYNDKTKGKRIGGVYKRALVSVVEDKLRLLREEKLKEKLNKTETSETTISEEIQETNENTETTEDGNSI